MIDMCIMWEASDFFLVLRWVALDPLPDHPQNLILLLCLLQGSPVQFDQVGLLCLIGSEYKLFRLFFLFFRGVRQVS